MLDDTNGQFRISKMTIYHDNNEVFGLTVQYQARGEKIRAKAVGKEYQKRMNKETLVLAPDEMITRVSGRIGNIMKAFGFTTNKGRSLWCGGEDGDYWAHDFKNNSIAAIGVGIGGHVHNVTLYYGPSPQISRFHNNASKLP